MINKRLIALARSSRTLLFTTILAGFLVGVLTIGGAWSLSKSVDAVFLQDLTMTEVSSSLQLLLVFILGRALAVWLGEISAGQLALRVKTDLRERLYRHLVCLGPGHARSERTGELINTLVEGIEALDAWFSGYLPQLVFAALLPLTFLFFVFPRDLLTGVVLLVTAPLIPLFMVLIGSLADALSKRQWKSLSYMSAHFLDMLQGLTTLKLLGASRAQIGVIKNVSDDFRKTTLGVLRVAFLSAFVLEIIATLSTAIVAVEIGLRLLYGRMVFQDAFFVLLLAPEFYLPLRMLGTRFHNGVAGVAAAERVFEILDDPITSDPYEADNPQEGSFCNQFDPNSSFQSPNSGHQFVIFDSVHYTYPDGRVALRNVSFTIEPGQKVALIGPSGAGKTTIAHLLLGFMHPTEGEVNVPSPSPASLPLREGEGWGVGEGIAWLPQTPYLFNDTIAANIRLARPNASMEEVIAAARSAHAHDFISNMAGHYETLIGERAARLSGGQAQRIALARAFLMDAPLIILDEPAAHIDLELEAQIQHSTFQLLEGRSALIIAHRLQTVVQADKIIVLDQGRVVGQGSHRELLSSNPLYAQMAGSLQVSPRPLGAERSEISTHGTQPEARDLPPTLPVHRSIIPRLLSFLAGSWNWIALSVLFGFATIASSIGLLGASAYIISAAATQPSIAVLQVPIVGVRFFGIARGVFRYVERLVSHQVTFRLLARLRVWFYEKLEPLSPARLQMFPSGDLLSRVIADIDTLQNFYTRAVAPPVVAVCIALFGGALLAQYHWKLTLALWIFFALAGILLPWLTLILARGVGGTQLAVRASLNIALVDGIQGLPDLLAFGRVDDQIRMIRTLGEDLATLQKRSTLIVGMRAALMSLLTNLGMGVVLVLAIHLVSAGQLDGVYLATIALIALASFEALVPLPQAAQHLDENTAAARRLFEIVDAPPAVIDPAEPFSTPPSFDIEIKNLSFRYPNFPYPTSNLQFPIANFQSPTLNQISFSLPQGKSLAIVGPSGAGKTTLLNLLLRFWEYQQGEILLDGQDLRDFPQEDIRACFGVVSQDTHFFNGSVRENLLLGSPTATDEQIESAARGAQIHRFIESLPDGYDTWIGEQGFNLSGGERQRLSLARALLKDTPILLLDEPTAHLDLLTGRAFMRSLQNMPSQRSQIIISHQLTDLDWVDEILVMRQGQIVERGTHHSLLRSDGYYSRMWDLMHPQKGVTVESSDSDVSNVS